MSSRPQGAATSHASTHAQGSHTQQDDTCSSNQLQKSSTGGSSGSDKNKENDGKSAQSQVPSPQSATLPSASTGVARPSDSASVEETQLVPLEASRSHSPSLQSGATTKEDATSPPSTSKARSSSAAASSTAKSNKASTSSRKSSSSMTKNGSRSSKSKSSRPSKGEVTDMSGDEGSTAQLQPKQEETDAQNLGPQNAFNEHQLRGADTAPRPKSESAQADAANHSKGSEGADESADQEAADSSSTDSAIGQSRRQRSASTKELAGLGLAHLGDGEEEVLAPRRSRRAVAASPSTEGKQLPGDDATQEDEKVAEASQVAAGIAMTPEVSMDSMHASKAKHDETATEADQSLLEADESLPTGPGAADEDGEGDIEGVTRCVCGSTDENVGLMIQCETCKCWQHCVCMGMHTEEDCPDVYYCEQCKPELHIPLLRALGVLPSARSHKKGASRLNGKNPAKEAAKELREAREAVAVLAKQNAQRRRDGIEPLVATTVPPRGRRTTSESQESSVDKVPPSPRTNATSEGPHPAPPSNASAGAAPSGSASSASGRRSPKRRSTMNSRDSMYGGWEAIPPGLLNEDEVWDDGAAAKREEEEAAGRKRKRTTRRDEEPSPSPAASPQMGPAELAKRRRMSGSASRDAARKALSPNPTESALALSPTGGSERTLAASRKSNGGAGAPSSGSGVGSGSKSGAAASTHASTSSTARNRHATEEASATPSLASSASNHLHPSGAAASNGSNGTAATPVPPTKPKQPNQYTHRKERASAAAAALAAGAGRTVSPTPSPSKSGRRGAAALREGSTVSQSRNGTPVPGDSKNNKGAPWGMPDHLSHLAHLLPSAQPEPLQLHMPTTKGLGRNADAHHGSSSGARPSPHAFNILDLNEPPTKVRFPSKRMTLGEMRKRVRNISEYVTRTQLEAVERGKRMKALGITLSPSSYVDAVTADGTDEGAQAAAEAESTPMEGVEGAGTPANGEEKQPATAKAEGSTTASAKEAPAPTPISMHLLDNLTREIIAFQQKFGVPPGTSGPGPLSGGSTSASAGNGSTPSAGADDGATTGLGLGLT